MEGSTQGHSIERIEVLRTTRSALCRDVLILFSRGFSPYIKPKNQIHWGGFLEFFSKVEGFSGADIQALFLSDAQLAAIHDLLNKLMNLSLPMPFERRLLQMLDVRFQKLKTLVSRHHGCIHPIDMNLTIYYVVGDDGIYGIGLANVSDTVVGMGVQVIDGGWEEYAWAAGSDEWRRHKE
ncbi:hypothetical protein Tco_0595625 [Tanacetum coccineum]